MKTCPLCDSAYPSHHATCPIDGALLVESCELEPGTIVRDKFRIVRKLGHGGMGTVYLAGHILLCRQCALKFISADLAQDPDFLQCFRREAQAAIELRHPNIVKVVDFDQAEDGTPFIAMEYIAGPDLRHALNQAARDPDSDLAQYQGSTSVAPQSRENEPGALAPEGSFPVPRALAIVRGLAQGLGAAHAKGIVHRDIKPENILLASAIGAPETPKLVDFGAAAMRDAVATISGAHGLTFTPQYAAPEQWRGVPTEDLDARTDFYALGGVLYEMLTGQTAFDARNAEAWMYQHLHTEPEPPSQLRLELADWQGLDSLVLRLLAKDREQRPHDAAELIALVDAVIHVDPDVSRVTQHGEPGIGWNQAEVERRRQTAVLAWVAVATVAVAALFSAPWIFAPKPPSNSKLQYPSRSERARGPSAAPAPSIFKPGDTSSTSTVAQPGVFDAMAVVEAPGSKPGAQSSVIAGIEQRAEALDSQERYSEAKALYEQACSRGSGAACMNIGVLYEDGNGVEKDFTRAAGFYSRACNQGDADGCNLLGFMYETGLFGLAKNYSQAIELYSKACNAGNPNGCEGLGSIYGLGEGVQRDERKAEMFDLEACNKGSAGSCVSVAEIHEGSGSISEARRLYLKACSIGAKYACDMADKLPSAPQ